MEANTEEPTEKRICHQCIGEEYLKAEVQKNGTIAQCSYCDQVANSYTIEEIADLIETAFEKYFYRTSDQPTSQEEAMATDPEFKYEWEREGNPVIDVIQNIAKISLDTADDILSILAGRHSDFDSEAMNEETEFSGDSYYAELTPDDSKWQAEWRKFKNSLKSEARFFIRNAAQHLAAVFNYIDKLVISDKKPLVIEVGPNMPLSVVFRARVFQSDQKIEEALCHPDLHLGSPPTSLAIAGRMNAHGISVFYAATSPEIAIAEVRPPVGSQVAIARFEIIRPLRLLDLTALDTVIFKGSVFDPDWADRRDRILFLASLSQQMTQPVMPNDETFDYLPTQAIADFLGTENEPLLDGIAYPTAQTTGDGQNIVLFHKAARVESIDFPENTKITARTMEFNDDGWERNYQVVEEISSLIPPKRKNPDSNFMITEDNREVTLKIVPKSEKVHIIKKIKFETDEYSVSKYRWQRKMDTLF